MATNVRTIEQTSPDENAATVLEEHGRHDDPMAQHLLCALERTDDDVERYHLREALQLLVAEAA